MTRAEKIRESRRLKALGWTAPKIGRYLGVSDSTIRNWYLGGECVDCGAPTTYNTPASPSIRCEPCYLKSVESEHGTRARYARGCGCDACREANTAYQRKLKGRTPPNHGYSGYINYGCRCDVCKEGHLIWSRKVGQEYQKRHLEKMRSLPTPDMVHGTMRGYRVFACRCDPCRAAAAEYWRARRSKAAA